MKVALLADASSINVQRWQQGLERAGLEVYTLTLHAPDPRPEHVYPLTTPPIPGKLRYLAAVTAVKKQLRLLRPDLLIAYFVTGYGTLGRLSGFRPLVQVTAGNDILVAPSKPFMRQLVRANLHSAELIVCWAPHVAQVVERMGILPQKIMTLPRGIPLHEFNTVRAAPPVANEPARLISTRSLYPTYKLDVLIRSVEQLKLRGVDFELTIVGDGPERATLNALADTLKLRPNVTFAGAVSNDRLASVLAQHNLYISLNQSDSVSASLLEAMTVGLCPIVADNAANRYWIRSGENGLLVASITPEKVADTIQLALSNLKLRSHARNENPHITAQRADLYKNTGSYADKFREIVARWRSATNIRR